MEWTGDASEVDCQAYNLFLNLSDPSSAVAYEYDRVDIALVTTVYPVTATIGLLTNLAFLVTVLRVKYMRTLTNVYLSSLAISDIMFLLTGEDLHLK